MRALVPLLEDAVPGELVRDLNQSVANLQLAYAKAASTAAAPDDDSTSGNGEDAPPAG
jgi:hypothetical protein